MNNKIYISKNNLKSSFKLVLTSFLLMGSFTACGSGGSSGKNTNERSEQVENNVLENTSEIILSNKPRGLDYSYKPDGRLEKIIIPKISRFNTSNIILRDARGKSISYRKIDELDNVVLILKEDIEYLEDYVLSKQINIKEKSLSIKEDKSYIGGNLLTEIVNIPNKYSVEAFSKDGNYGKIEVKEDGSYKYYLDNKNSNVQALDDGQSISESFIYNIKDEYDVISKINLLINIEGSTDTKPEIKIDNTNNQVEEKTGDKLSGEIRVGASSGIVTLSINGKDIKNSSTDPVSITTSNGTLKIKGYDKKVGVISYEYIENNIAKNHTNGEVIDEFEVKLIDLVGDSLAKSLVITILDTEVSAKSVSNTIQEDKSSVTGQVEIEAGKDTYVIESLNKIGKYGNLTLNSDGSYTYTLDNTKSEVQSLNTGVNINDIFEYVVRDSDGDVSSAKLSIKITGVTDTPPSINIEQSSQKEIEEKSTGSISGTIEVSAQAGVLSVEMIQDESVGTQEYKDITKATSSNPILFNTSNGILKITSYQAGRIIYEYLVNSEAKNHSNNTQIKDEFSIKVIDRQNLSVVDNLSIEILDTQATANPVSVNIVEDSTEKIIDINSAISHSKDEENISIENPQGTYGHLQKKSDGTFAYILDNTKLEVQALKEGRSLNDTFKYIVSDIDGDESENTINVTISGVNDTPVARDYSVRTAKNQNVLIDILQNVLDVDAGDSIVISKINGQNVIGSNSINLGNNVIVEIKANAQLEVKLPSNYTNTINFTYKVSDNKIESNEANIKIVIKDTNTAPVAVLDEKTIDEDGVLNVPVVQGVLKNDTDVDQETLSVSDISFNGTAGSVGSAIQGKYGTLILNSDGSYTYTPNASAKALDVGQFKTDIFKYKVKDTSDAKSNEADLRIEVQGSNDANIVVDGAMDVLEREGAYITNSVYLSKPVKSNVEVKLIPSGNSRLGIDFYIPLQYAPEGSTNWQDVVDDKITLPKSGTRVQVRIKLKDDKETELKREIVRLIARSENVQDSSYISRKQYYVDNHIIDDSPTSADNPNPVDEDIQGYVRVTDSNPSTVREGQSADTYLVYTVFLGQRNGDNVPVQPINKNINLRLSTHSGTTARRGDDFENIFEYQKGGETTWREATNDIITLNAQNPTAKVRVKVIDDNLGGESTEKIVLRADVLQNEVNPQIKVRYDWSEGVIEDNDEEIRVTSINASDIEEGEELNYTVSFNNASHQNETISLKLVNVQSVLNGTQVQISTDGGSHWESKSVDSNGNISAVVLLSGKTSLKIKVPTNENTTDGENQTITLEAKTSSQSVAIQQSAKVKDDDIVITQKILRINPEKGNNQVDEEVAVVTADNQGASLTFSVDSSYFKIDDSTTGLVTLTQEGFEQVNSCKNLPKLDVEISDGFVNTIVSFDIPGTKCQNTSSIIGRLATGQKQEFQKYDDGYYQSSSNPRDFTQKHFTGYWRVIDNQAMLQWRDDIKASDYNKAKKYCDELVSGGHFDWRLPTVVELSTMIDHSKKHQAVFEEFYQNNVSGTSIYFWTSDMNKIFDESTQNMYVINFEDGSITTRPGNLSSYVRCVRNR